MDSKYSFDQEVAYLKDQLSGPVEESGDSGISNSTTPLTSTSPRYHTSDKLSEVELEVEEKVHISSREIQDAKLKLEELRQLRIEEKSLLQNEISHLHITLGKEEGVIFSLENELRIMRELSDRFKGQVQEQAKQLKIYTEIREKHESHIAYLERRLDECAVDQNTAKKTLDEQEQLLCAKNLELATLNSNSVFEREKLLEALKAKESLEFQLEEQRALAHKEREEFAKLRSEHGETCLKLEIAKSENFAEKLEIRKLQICLERNERERLGLTAEIAYLTDQKRNSENAVEVMTKANIAANERISTLEGNETSQRQALDDLKVKVIDSERRLEQLNLKLSETDKQLHTTLQSLAKLSQESSEKLNERHAQIESMRESLEKAHQKNFAVKESLRSTRTAVQKFLEQVSKVGVGSDGMEELLRFKCRLLKSTDCKQSVEHTTFAENREGLLHSQELSDALGEILDQVHRMQDEREQLHLEIQSLSQNRESLEKASRKLTLQWQEAEKLADQERNKNEALEGKYRKAEAKMSALELNNQMLLSQKSELEIQVAKIEESMKAMNSNYRKARKRNDELEDDLKQERHQCQNRVKELEERCAQLEGSYKARTAELRDGKRPKDDDEMWRREKDAMRAELDDLIDDNKSLAQRLIHLESYSDKLSGLVEKHQNEAREAKSRLQKNAEDYEKELKAKDREMTEITHRMNKMTKNLQEANENTERLDLKCEQAWERLQELQTEKKSIEEKYVTVKSDLAIVKEAQTAAERRAVCCEENLDKLNKTLIEHANTVRMLQEKIIKLRQEKKVLMQTLDVNKNSYVSRKHQLHESEEGKHLIEQKPDPLKNIESDSVQGKLVLSSFPSEVGRKQKDFPELVAENQFLKEQLSHVQRRLADAEDNYDQYLSEVNLCTCRCDVDREHVKGPEDGVQRLQISDLQKQIQQFQRELSAERSERERLEALVNRREEQVDTLRLSFDKSLSAITRDTHNIKNMLGKSLHKIDRQMLVDQGLASNSDITEFTSDSSDERALPAKRHLRTISTKSYTSTMGRLQEYRKVNADLRRSLDDREKLRGSPLGSASTSQSQSSLDSPARYACARQRKPEKTVD